MFLMRFFEKPFLRKESIERIQRAIEEAELRTSGEVRVFIERRCEQKEALGRAKAIFFKQQMQCTAQRNGIIIYVAYGSKKVAIYGDEGIHAKVGQAYWEGTIERLVGYLKGGLVEEGLVEAIKDVGDKLGVFFPFDRLLDKNELPNEIMFKS